MKKDVKLTLEGIHFDARDVAGDPLQKFLDRTMPQFWQDLDKDSRESKLKGIHEACAAEVAKVDAPAEPEAPVVADPPKETLSTPLTPETPVVADPPKVPKK